MSLSLLHFLHIIPNMVSLQMFQANSRTCRLPVYALILNPQLFRGLGHAAARWYPNLRVASETFCHKVVLEESEGQAPLGEVA